MFAGAASKARSCGRSSVIDRLSDLAAPVLLRPGFSSAALATDGSVETADSLQLRSTRHPSGLPAHFLPPKSVRRVTSSASRPADEPVEWVFLGAPGVGKGTYASRLAKLLGVPHISTGDLVRAEMTSSSGRSSPLTEQVRSLVARGQLLPDELVLALLSRRLQAGREAGETGFILDGFPRTTSQAEALQELASVRLAVNLSLREEVLLAKMLGRRACRECGRGFNLADIHLPAAEGRPAIDMPALLPPAQCRGKMVSREDDTEAVVRARIEAYRDQVGGRGLKCMGVLMWRAQMLLDSKVLHAAAPLSP